MTDPCRFLQWDSEFFGVRIARVNDYRLDVPLAAAIDQWCLSQAVDCIYFLADSDHAETAQLAEEQGYKLVDVRVTLECSLAGWQPQETLEQLPEVLIRPALPEYLPALKAIAASSHTDTRFFYDPCFPEAACRCLYETWIEKSCNGYTQKVLAACSHGIPVGYITCSLAESPAPAQIGLFAVSASARGRGIGPRLIRSALDWFATKEVKTVQVVTQGRNLAAQRAYQRSGFLTCSVQLWYHKWFSECPGLQNV